MDVHGGGQRPGEQERQATADAARRDVLRAWTEQLYKEYDNVLFHFGLKLPVPVIRIVPLAGSWGLWRPEPRTITVNAALIERYSWDVVIEVLKHEMAHQLADERLGGRDGHGPRFQEACRRLGVAPWAAAASGELPREIPSWRDRVLGPEEERLLKRAEKLLALAASGNEHEAALAAARVRQLYAKYNLERLRSRAEPQHVYCIINRKQKRIAAEESAIYSLLNEHFFVRAIFTSQYDALDGCEYKAVELLGSRPNVLMAEYVFHFLRRTLDTLWADYRRATDGGRRSRRSYMLGVLSGFRRKLAAAPETGAAQTPPGQAKENGALLVLAARQLDGYVDERHPRLTNRRVGNAYGDRASFSAGVAAGGAITLHRGLTHHDGNRGLRLGSGK